MTSLIFPNWNSEHTVKWTTAPISIEHTIHKSPLFSDDALASLIDRYPRGAYGLIHTGGHNERKLWREGDKGRVPGAKVIEAIGQGRMWLNLRHASDIDPGYRALLDQMFAELEQQVPGFHTMWLSMGILISSPGARVYYHADMPGQALAQIRGRKRVFVYPAEPPFLTPEELEKIALNDLEVGLAYDPAFDAKALVLDIEPGQMLHWPLNAPHRVDNHDCLNVSITIEYLTPDIRRHQIVTAANGILRQKLGLRPKSSAISGPLYWTKALLQAGVRRTGLLAKSRQRPVTFMLDPTAPGGIRDLVASELAPQPAAKQAA